MKTLTTVSLTIAIALASGASYARGGFGGMMDGGGALLDHHAQMIDVLAKYDSNGDGRLSGDEIAAAQTAEFTRADSDASGSLSLGELQAMHTQRRADALVARFAVLDADANGSISQTELQAMHPLTDSAVSAAVFKLADTDASGGLNQAELQGLEDNKGAWWGFASLDDNADGAISQAEFLAAQPQRGMGGMGGRH